jgi:hypothetical protein
MGGELAINLRFHREKHEKNNREGAKDAKKNAKICCSSAGICRQTNNNFLPGALGVLAVQCLKSA